MPKPSPSIPSGSPLHVPDPTAVEALSLGVLAHIVLVLAFAW